MTTANLKYEIRSGSYFVFHIHAVSARRAQNTLVQTFRPSARTLCPCATPASIGSAERISTIFQFIFQSPASYRSLRAHTHRRATSRERRVEAGDHRPPFAAGPTSCSRYRLISTPRLCTPASEDRAWNVGAAAIFIMPPQGRVWAGENVRGPPSASISRSRHYSHTWRAWAMWSSHTCLLWPLPDGLAD